MGDEPVDLVEAARVEQQRDALARGELAGLVLAAEAILAASELGEATQLAETLRHGVF